MPDDISDRLRNLISPSKKVLLVMKVNERVLSFPASYFNAPRQVVSSFIFLNVVPLHGPFAHVPKEIG